MATLSCLAGETIINKEAVQVWSYRCVALLSLVFLLLGRKTCEHFLTVIFSTRKKFKRTIFKMAVIFRFKSVLFFLLLICCVVNVDCDDEIWRKDMTEEIYIATSHEGFEYVNLTCSKEKVSCNKL